MENERYDAVVIGAGTAGMTAGIYLARRGKTAVVLEGNMCGGQIVNTPQVENYPGIKSVSGYEFADNMRSQLIELGGRIEYAKAIGIRTDGGTKTVVTADKEYVCDRVIIAVGAKSRSLGIENEQELIGRGVSYCATCDGVFFRGKDAAVVGGGNTALEDAEFLSDLCRKVYLIHRRDEFRGDSAAVDKLRQKNNVEFVLSSTVEKLVADNNRLSAIIVKNKNDETREISVSGLFIAIGQVPDTDFLRGVADMDENGYIIAGEDCKTSADGIYAAGDCRTKSLRQLTPAAADGAVSTIY